MNPETIQVRVLAFARLRELLGFAERVIDVESGATAQDLWDQLAQPSAASLAASTRFARNGRIVAATQPLDDGDELAFLPPVGGG